MARLRLEQLGHLRGGFPARSGTTDRPEEGRFRALQAKDLRPHGGIGWDQLTWVSEGPLPGKYRVTTGDVVMPLRSTPLRATVIRDAPPDVVAVGPWVLLTPNRSLVEPDFLAWYLAQPVAMAQLRSLLRGTKLQFLSFTALRAFEVELPPLAIQRRIVRATALNARVTELELRLAAARRKLVDTLGLGALRRAMEPEGGA